MASIMVSPDDTIVPPETLPGIRILGFECCHCKAVTFDQSLGKCYDEQCSHKYCLDCTVMDRAGRRWTKQLRIPVSWLCQCGSSHTIGDTLMVDETGKIAKPVCSCEGPSFLAMYNTYGRICKGLRFSIALPFALGTSEAVKTLVAELEQTSYGPCIRRDREVAKTSQGKYQ